MRYIFPILTLLVASNAFSADKFTAANDPYLIACKKMIAEASDTAVPLHAKTEPKVCYCARIGYVVEQDTRLGRDPKDTMQNAQAYMKELASLTQDEREHAMLKSLQDEFRNSAKFYKKVNCPYQ